MLQVNGREMIKLKAIILRYNKVIIEVYVKQQHGDIS